MSDLDEYWKNRGQRYMDDFYLGSKYGQKRFKDQEKFLVNLIKDEKFDSILEVGCGFGRYTKILHSLFSPKKYVAIDISEKQIGNARKFLNNDEIEFIVSRFQEYDSHEKFDLVFASEILMHIPPDDINQFVAKLKNSSKKRIVSIDLFEKESNVKLDKHCFIHNYKEIFENCGAKNIEIHKIPISIRQKTVGIYSKLRGKNGLAHQAVISVEN